MLSSPLLLGVETTRLGEVERDRFARLQPAGYLLLARNFESPEQARELTDSLRELHDIDPILAVDDELSLLIRFGALPADAPSPAELAVAASTPAIADRGAFSADLLRLLGINLVLGPHLDIARDPGTFRSASLWHEDPQRIIDHAGMWNRWLRKHKVRSCARSFPGPGGERTLSDLLREDLIPYTALMPELDAIQVGHGRFPALDPRNPASLSRRIVTSLLRDQLGFDRHLVLTADLCDERILRHHAEGEAVVAALKAGHDLAVVAGDPLQAENAARSLEKVPTMHLQDADRRLERFRKRLHDPLPWDPDRWKRTAEKLAS